MPKERVSAAGRKGGLRSRRGKKVQYTVKDSKIDRMEEFYVYDDTPTIDIEPPHRSLMDRLKGRI